MKRPIAVKNRPRVVNFWMRNAVTGIMMPLTSMKIVVTHWASLAVMPKSSMNAGSAVLRSVWLRMMTNAPDSRTPMTMLRLTGDWPSAPAVPDSLMRVPSCLRGCV